MRKLHLKRWEIELGPLYLSQLNHFRINAALERWSKNGIGAEEKKIQPATLNRHRNSLSVVLDRAVKRWGWMGQNPCRNAISFIEPKQACGKSPAVTSTS
jgi:hypothetical protein